MLHRLKVPSPALVVSTVAVVLALGGGALALGSTTIHACVAHRGGTLYSAHRCHRGDRGISWNSVGPRGATGRTGSTGPQGSMGSQGPVGPSVAFEAYRDAGVPLPATGATQTVATLSGLGAGPYLISATTTLDYAVTNDYVDCQLNASGDTDTAGSYMGISATARATLSMQLTHTFVAGAGAVTVSCHKENSGGGVPLASQTKIVAVRLGAEMHGAVTS